MPNATQRKGLCEGIQYPTTVRPALFVYVGIVRNSCNTVGLNWARYSGPFAQRKRTCIQRTIPSIAIPSKRLPGSNVSRI